MCQFQDIYFSTVYITAPGLFWMNLRGEEILWRLFCLCDPKVVLQNLGRMWMWLSLLICFSQTLFSQVYVFRRGSICCRDSTLFFYPEPTVQVFSTCSLASPAGFTQVFCWICGEIVRIISWPMGADTSKGQRINGSRHSPGSQFPS